MHKTQIINQETGKSDIRTVMNVRICIDDRIAPGIYTGPTIDLMKSLIENPEPLIDSPELTDEQLDKLMLKKYKKERLEREKQRKKAAKKRK